MITYHVKGGTTDFSVVIRIVDSADGTPETGVVYNTSGIDLEYRREGAASTDITEASLSALTDAHSDGGFLHIGNGYYRLDLPDAAVAAGVNGCLVHGTVTGMIVIGCYIQIVAAPVDVTHWLGTAAATPTVAGVPEVDVTHWIGTAAATPTTAGVPEVDVTYWSGTAVATPDTAGYPKVTIKSGTGTGELSISSGIVDADVQEINGDSGSADQFARSTAAIVLGTCTTGCTTTSIATSSLSPAAAVADQFKGRIVIFDDATTTAALRGQATDITASTSGGVLTVTALTTAPASGDTFTIT